MDSSDSLRHPANAPEPDARTHHFSRIEENTGILHSVTLVDQHSAIACYTLNSTVPEKVAIHFETAKNLYLYAWFIFRFYPVAEQQALISLEFALRERLVDYVKEYKERHPKAGPLGLAKLLSHAKTEGLIRNEVLNGREAWALNIARRRHSVDIINEMIATGANEMEFDDSHIVSSKADLQHDWLGDFVKAIPDIRNDYAHGNPTLRHTVLHTFDVVSQLINQLYPEPGVSSK